MKLPIYTFSTAETSQSLEIPSDRLAIKGSKKTLHQAVVTEAANQRVPHGHSKNRGEVSGGGRKPWRQKGTGRARQSSTRSPVWVGGGIAFGPQSNRNFTKNLPKTMRTRAFQMALRAQLEADLFRVIDQWGELTGKTSQFVKQLTKLPELGHRTLVILDDFEPKVVLAARNVPYLQLTTVAAVRSTDLLLADSILITQAGFVMLLQRAYGFEVEVREQTKTQSKVASATTKDEE